MTDFFRYFDVIDPVSGQASSSLPNIIIIIIIIPIQPGLPMCSGDVWFANEIVANVTVHRIYLQLQSRSVHE